MTRLPLPASSADLTVDWLNQALGGDVTQGTTIVDLQREVIGEGAGFVGELTRITPTYSSNDADAPRSLIAKLPTAVQQQARTAYRRFQDNPEHPAYTSNLSTPRIPSTRRGSAETTGR